MIECVWYTNKATAKAKARRISKETADPMFVVEDLRTGMYGVGLGDKHPPWCRLSRGFLILVIIRPRSN